MLGKEYANHLPLLFQSFSDMNRRYRKKAREKKESTFIREIKRLYIVLFGIPEIGFQIRGIYFKKIMSCYLKNKRLKNILDAGCGIGAYTFFLSNLFPGSKVEGGDIDKFKLHWCQIMNEELAIQNVSFSFLDISKKSKKDGFNLVVTIDVLEHIENYKTAIRNLHALLKKNGFLYIHVPQPNQKRIIGALKKWHHEDHVHEGISKNELENTLKKTGFKIITSKETFGFFGKLAWEINHLALSKSFVIAGITFPFLYILAIIDGFWNNRKGLGLAVLAQKK